MSNGFTCERVLFSSFNAIMKRKYVARISSGKIISPAVGEIIIIKEVFGYSFVSCTFDEHWIACPQGGEFCTQKAKYIYIDGQKVQHNLSYESMYSKIMNNWI